MTIQQTEGFIYLAEKRACIETNTFRSFKTSNTYVSTEGGKPNLCPIKSIHDNTLAAGEKQVIIHENRGITMILPLIGALEVQSTEGVTLVEPGAVHYVFFNKNDEISIVNPYDNELINYLEIYFDNHFPIQQFESLTYYFDLNADKNALHPLLDMEQQRNSNLPFKSLGWIGQYDGRNEDIMKVKNAQSSLFVYVINGVFEVQNRLLQPRDGLFLWHLDEAEFEALADNSILLCF